MIINKENVKYIFVLLSTILCATGEEPYSNLQTNVNQTQNTMLGNKIYKQPMNVNDTQKQIYKQPINVNNTYKQIYKTPKNINNAQNLNIIETQQEPSRFSIEIQKFRNNIQNLAYSRNATNFIINYAKLISDINNISGNDKNKILEYIIQQFNVIRYEIIECLKNIQKEISMCKLNVLEKHIQHPLLASKIQKYIGQLEVNQIEDINDIKKYDPNKIIIETTQEINPNYFKTELDYVLYYIENNNIFSEQYVAKYTKNIFNVYCNKETFPEEYNKARTELLEIMGAMSNSKIFKNQYDAFSKEYTSLAESKSIYGVNIANNIEFYQENRGNELHNIKFEIQQIIKENMKAIIGGIWGKLENENLKNIINGYILLANIFYEINNKIKDLPVTNQQSRLIQNDSFNKIWNICYNSEYVAKLNEKYLEFIDDKNYGNMFKQIYDILYKDIKNYTSIFDYKKHVNKLDIVIKLAKWYEDNKKEWDPY